MRFHLTPRPLLDLLVTTLLFAPRPTFANPRPVASVQNGFSFNDLFKRYECSGELCGYNDQLCCQAGSTCYTDSNNEAQCATGSGYASASAAPVQSSAAGGGYWVYITTTTVMTNYETVTTVYSSFVPRASHVSVAASASASATSRCNYALNESPCGDICCAGNQYCAYAGQCSLAAAGQTTTKTSGYASQSAGAPLRPTSSGVVVVTATQSHTTTVPFQPPVATGANVTMTESQTSGGGLSGGAIAGIVIGVLIGLLILGLICFYCCLKGLLDGCLALFGLGKKRKRTEVEEYERRTHHSSRGGGRTWYGAAKPSRVDRREKRESHTGRELLGLGAGLAGLWAILGMKRRSNRKKEEKYSEYSYSSDYYTSESSASSDDRRTRTHRSASRSRR